jgi:uncharacterized membrane protein HdeD (DUF308 family)
MSTLPSKKKHGKRFWFWVRFLLWSGLAIIIPTVVIITQYDIFTERNSLTKVTGWGLVFLLALAGGIFYIVKSLGEAEDNPWINGMARGVKNIILPLLLIYYLTGIIAFNLVKFNTILIVTLIAEGIALPLNPFPQYIHQRRQEKRVKENLGISVEELKSISQLARTAELTNKK